MPISTRVPLTRSLRRSHVALSLRSALACVEHELQQERSSLANPFAHHAQRAYSTAAASWRW